MKKHRAWLFLFGGVLLLVAVDRVYVFNLPARSAYENSQKTEKAKQYQQNFESPMLSVLSDIEGFIGAHEKLLIVLFTGAIAWFTGTLWRTTTGQLQELRVSVRLARDEFISSHRPKLVVRRFQFNPGRDEGFFIRFVIANVGQTKATIIHDNITIRVLPIDQMPLLEINSFPMHQLGNENVLVKKIYQRGEREAQEIHLGGIQDEPAARLAIREGKAGLVCFGFFRYRDDAGGEYETGFFRTSQVGKEFLVPSEDPDYEYS